MSLANLMSEIKQNAAQQPNATTTTNVDPVVIEDVPNAALEESANVPNVPQMEEPKEYVAYEQPTVNPSVAALLNKEPVTPVAQAPVQPQASAVQTPVNEAETTKVAKATVAGDNANLEDLKTRGIAVRNNYSDEEKELEGSQTGIIQFINAVGNPAVKQSRREQQKTLHSYQVVGYTFKALEEVDVPLMPFSTCPDDLLDVEPQGYRHIAKDEEFTLNLMETLIFITEPRFGGQFDGNGVIVRLQAKWAKSKKKPLPTLNKLKTQGSVKENMQFVGTKQDDGSYVVKDEYKLNFGNLYNARKITRPTSSGTNKIPETTLNTAAGYREYLKTDQAFAAFLNKKERLNANTIQ